MSAPEFVGGDRSAQTVAIRAALAKGLDAAWLRERSYLALPAAHAGTIAGALQRQGLSDLRWDGGFCITRESVDGSTAIYHDGAVVLLCLLTADHVGPCGYEHLRGSADRTAEALADSALVRRWEAVACA